MHDYLVNCGNTKYQYCMAGFILDNTLSDNGTVTRGVCQVDDEEMLQKIVETSGIARDTDGIVKDENGSEIPEGTHVSMNMWGVTPEFLDVLDKGFAEFLANVEPGNIKAEYLLPTIIGQSSGDTGQVVWCNLSGRPTDGSRCICTADRRRRI